jgi:hypothetical protein
MLIGLPDFARFPARLQSTRLGSTMYIVESASTTGTTTKSSHPSLYFVMRGFVSQLFVNHPNAFRSANSQPSGVNGTKVISRQVRDLVDLPSTQ